MNIYKGSTSVNSKVNLTGVWASQGNIETKPVYLVTLMKYSMKKKRPQKTSNWM